MKAHRLILWDVDGTLVRAGPAARDAFDLAVASVIGRDAIDHGIHMSGKTDPQIALEILAAMAVSDDEARRHLPAVLQALERQLEAAVGTIRRDGRVLPGVRDLLFRLHSRPDVAQSVLTGNLAANARLKLGAFGLDRYLDLEVGAYGSDDADRTKLVPIALAKLEALRGVRLEPEAVWVVGDTPNDLACARAGGARCLLVGTGVLGGRELDGLDPDAMFDDLADTAEVERVLGLAT